MESLGIALAYGDVRLKTGYSELMPDSIDIESKFSKKIGLKIPIVSAAMDTVTENKMAIAVAKEGGLGIIHKNLSIEQQASEVSKVKFHLNGFINKPICVSDEDTIEEILIKKIEKGYTFNSFPVLNFENKLIGLITKNDLDFCEDQNIKSKELMTQEIITAPVGTSIEQAYQLMKLHKKKILPLVHQNGLLAGIFVFSDVKRIKFGSHANYNIDENGQLRVGAAIGVGKEAIDRAIKLIEKGADVIVIDTAHGDSKPVFDTLLELKRNFYNIDIVVGNVSEPRSVERLIVAGADGIKIGQGPGSICTTRIIAGVGTPQVTAIYNAGKAAKGSGVPICADGGLTYSGDIAIAIGAGAHSVMMGSMIAGTDESPGDLVFWQNRQWKGYRGMGSLKAMETNKGSRERYGQQKTGKDEIVPEGIEGLVPYKGNLHGAMIQYIGGLKRGMGYVGAKNIEDMREISDFYRITNAGQKESHPHNIEITHQAPNYSPDNN